MYFCNEARAEFNFAAIAYLFSNIADFCVIRKGSSTASPCKLCPSHSAILVVLGSAILITILETLLGICNNLAISAIFAY